MPNHLSVRIHSSGCYYVKERKPQVKIYRDTTNKIFIKPNEILDKNLFPSGNYRLELQFLSDFFSEYYYGDNYYYNNPRFYVNQISPSRREVRLYSRTLENDDIRYTVDFQNNFYSIVGNDDDSTYPDYTFNWILTNDGGINLPINNYAFDSISNEGYTSLVLRLNNQLKTTFRNLSEVNVVREVLNTQEKEIIYVSNITCTFIGSGLNVDKTVN